MRREERLARSLMNCMRMLRGFESALIEPEGSEQRMFMLEEYRFWLQNAADGCKADIAATLHRGKDTDKGVRNE